MSHHARLVRLPTAIALAATLALGTSLFTEQARAQTSPFYVGVAQRFTHDANVTLAADGLPKVSSTVSTSMLLAGIDQPFGRQRFRANASVQANRYSSYGEYNNTGYALDAGLDWSTIERISGSLKLSTSQTLARFSPDETAEITKRNIETANDIAAVFRVGVVTPLTLEATLGHRDVHYSASELDARELKQDRVGLGARYVLSGALTLGVGVRHQQTDYPRYFATATPGEFVADRIKRDDLDLSADWVASGASTLQARVSMSRWRHSLASAGDFSGGTGSLAWIWRPTGKVSLNTRVSRESGTESSFIDRSSGSVSSIFGLANLLLPDQVDTSRVATALRLRADYEATAKIRVYALANLLERDFSDLPGLPGVSVTDRTNSFGLGASWAPLRSLLLSCDVRQDQRDASTVMRGYKSETYGCGAQFVLQ